MNWMNRWIRLWKINSWCIKNVNCQNNEQYGNQTIKVEGANMKIKHLKKIDEK